MFLQILKRYFAFIALLFLLPFGQKIFAQTDNQQILESMQSARRAELLREMDQGEMLMGSGDYEEADKKFRYVLGHVDVVPSSLVYFIGRNSFYLKQYKQSIDWLNKYIELKGTKGQYYFETISLLKEAEREYLAISSKNTSDTVSVVEIDTLKGRSLYDCDGNVKFICPVCKGKTIIIEEGKLGQVYKSCPYSDEHGFLTCQEYYQLLEGKLKPKF